MPKSLYKYLLNISSSLNLVISSFQLSGFFCKYPESSRYSLKTLL